MERPGRNRAAVTDYRPDFGFDPELLSSCEFLELAALGLTVPVKLEEPPVNEPELP